jgi:hypothetical protein
VPQQDALVCPARSNQLLVGADIEAVDLGGLADARIHCRGGGGAISQFPHLEIERVKTKNKTNSKKESSP